MNWISASAFVDAQLKWLCLKHIAHCYILPPLGHPTNNAAWKSWMLHIMMQWGSFVGYLEGVVPVTCLVADGVWTFTAPLRNVMFTFRGACSCFFSADGWSFNGSSNSIILALTDPTVSDSRYSSSLRKHWLKCLCIYWFVLSNCVFYAYYGFIFLQMFYIDWIEIKLKLPDSITLSSSLRSLSRALSVSVSLCVFLSHSLSHRSACAELMLGSRLWPTYLQLIPHVTDFPDPSWILNLGPPERECWQFGVEFVCEEAIPRGEWEELSEFRPLERGPSPTYI